ncbi:O-acetyl-ADP-ribose deacetylase MACROD1 [Pelomyxa schiedti]|nr:O-acetyl-ADP-ribose deacetylase MACROD1 [Pelomyxa schiedti]
MTAFCCYWPFSLFNESALILRLALPVGLRAEAVVVGMQGNAGVSVVGHVVARTGTHVCASFGSILDFTGDAIVNAANEGCTGGFGVDEVVNRAGGFQLKEARKALGGCATGNAKITPSFEHRKVRYIIHAVGPVYRINPLSAKSPSTDDQVREFFEERDRLLAMAYRNSMQISQEHSFHSLAFSLLSAGVFRGQRPLDDIIRVGFQTVLDSCYEGLESVHMVAYSEEEQHTMLHVAKDLFPDTFLLH